jgi:hypothetical protein
MTFLLHDAGYFDKYVQTFRRNTASCGRLNSVPEKGATEFARHFVTFLIVTT